MMTTWACGLMVRSLSLEAQMIVCCVEVGRVESGKHLRFASLKLFLKPFRECTHGAESL